MFILVTQQKVAKNIGIFSFYKDNKKKQLICVHKNRMSPAFQHIVTQLNQYFFKWSLKLTTKELMKRQFQYIFRKLLSFFFQKIFFNFFFLEF